MQQKLRGIYPCLHSWCIACTVSARRGNLQEERTWCIPLQRKENPMDTDSRRVSGHVAVVTTTEGFPFCSLFSLSVHYHLIACKDCSIKYMHYSHRGCASAYPPFGSCCIVLNRMREGSLLNRPVFGLFWRSDPLNLDPLKMRTPFWRPKLRPQFGPWPFAHRENGVSPLLHVMVKRELHACTECACILLMPA